MALTRTNPTMAARVLLQQQYIRAQMMGPILENLPCKRVENYAFEKSYCRPGVLITVTFNQEMKRGILDPTTNIVTERNSLDPHKGLVCHKDLVPVCINDTCSYYYPRTGKLITAPFRDLTWGDGGDARPGAPHLGGAGKQVNKNLNFHILARCFSSFPSNFPMKYSRMYDKHLRKFALFFILRKTVLILLSLPI